MALALLVTTLAGLATCLGGWLGTRPALLAPHVLAASLAFAAGLMLTISVVEIIPGALAGLGELVGPGPALAWVLGVAVLGMLTVVVISALIPHRLNPHRLNPGQTTGGRALERTRRGEVDARLLGSGMLLAVVVGLHNLPEGLATFVSTLQSPSGGVVLAVAIALHNVPEGLAVAAPIYAATGSRPRALLWATLSGLAEPVGAVLGYLALRAVLAPEWLDLSLALVAGMMIAVSFSELLPAACRYQRRTRESLVGFLLGAVVMVLSLWLLAVPTG